MGMHLPQCVTVYCLPIRRNRQLPAQTYQIYTSAVVGSAERVNHEAGHHHKLDYEGITTKSGKEYVSLGKRVRR